MEKNLPASLRVVERAAFSNELFYVLEKRAVDTP
jgi:hypothetical protein